MHNFCNIHHVTYAKGYFSIQSVSQQIADTARSDAVWFGAYGQS